MHTEFTAAPSSPVAGKSTDKNTFNIQTDRLQLAGEKEGLLFILLFISISDEVTFYLLLLGIIIFLCLLISSVRIKMKINQKIILSG